MNTQTEKPAAAQPPSEKKPRKLKRYLVTLDGVACGLAPYDKKIIGWRVIPKRGVLVKRPDDPKVFPGPRSAEAAIRDAIKLRGFYRTDIVEIPAKHRHLLEAGTFKVEVVHPLFPGEPMF
jgi:hypothetical protein